MLIDDGTFPRTETVVIAKNVLARAGLRSLLEKYVYRVVSSAEAVEKLPHRPVSGDPKLVLIAPDSLEDLSAQASACREQWPGARIVTIYDCLDAADDERVRASLANGCVSTNVSERTLLCVLDLLVRDDDDLFFIVQLRCEARMATQELFAPSTVPDSGHPSGNGAHPRPSQDDVDAPHKSNGAIYVRENDVTVAPAQSRAQRNAPKLSVRELQILDGLVHGLQNKLIAHRCGITEATVKVHMKSILRKIQVQNRTQAAVWAMGHDTQICEVLEQRLFASEPDHSVNSV